MGSRKMQLVVKGTLKCQAAESLVQPEGFCTGMNELESLSNWRDRVGGKQLFILQLNRKIFGGINQCLFKKVLFLFGCVGSSLLRAGFLQLQQVGATLHCGVRASHCGGFSCCGAQALGAQASVVAAHGLSSCGAWALGCAGFSSCGSQALGPSGFSSCGVRAQQFWLAGSRALRLQQLWREGSVVLAHRLQGTQASVVVAHTLSSFDSQALGSSGFSSCGLRALERRLSSCGAQAQLLHSMWDLPGPGIKPVSPACAG